MFKKKKTEEFALNPEMQGMQPGWQDPANPYSSPDMSRDYNFGSPPQQDPYSQMNQMPHQNYQPQENVPQFSPEQAGFDRIRERDNFPTRQNQSVSEINIGKDLELINAKLDAIKSELDSVNQRIKRIERINEGGDRTPEKRDPWQY